MSIGSLSISRHGKPRRLAAFLVVVALAALLAGTASPRVARGAGVSVNLDQYATLAKAWQNGNLNGNNATYPEGGIVPFRLAIENLTRGKHTIHINYDFTAGGHKAYDFLATWNAWSKPGACATSGGGISDMCPTLPGSSNFPIPSDPFKTDGLSVKAAETYSGVPRRLTIWGGTITSISVPRHSGSTAGNSSADITVTFTSSGSSVLLAWGGHLAQSAFWNAAADGASDGAGEVSGAPWHMRTLNLDGAGAKNQDRSIQPSAINGALPPYALAPTPRPTGTPRAAAPAPTPRPDPLGPGDPVAELPWLTTPPTDSVRPPTTSSDMTPALLTVLLAGALVAMGSVRRRGQADPGPRPGR